MYLLFHEFSMSSFGFRPSDLGLNLVRYFLLTLSVLTIAPASAQKEASQYFYWKDAGIKFNTQGIESYTNTNNISHIQPGKDFSPVLCDPEGNLLMYTNMETIYDRTGQVMENGDGLFANRNGEQGAVWIDLPASRGRYYYLFYSDAGGTAFGNFPYDSIVSYALIDMHGNNGLGRVVQKNILLHGGSSGFIAAVRHQNDVDTWVMTYHFHRKEFMAYLVTSCGIKGPVITKDEIDKTFYDVIDPPPQLRFSPQGNMLAWYCTKWGDRGSWLMEF
jgi:hypothetical protein